MTAFEAGFITYANEYGLSTEQTAHIYKRAMEHSEAGKLFETFPTEKTNDPTTVGILANMLKHEIIDDRMRAAKKKIRL
jgi:hypothetical protein